jgi:hypothetical protein
MSSDETKSENKTICSSELILVSTSILGLKTSKKYFFSLLKENKEHFLQYEKVQNSSKFVRHKLEKNTTVNIDVDTKKKKFSFIIILSQHTNLELNCLTFEDFSLWKKSFEKCKISIKSIVKTKNVNNQTIISSVASNFFICSESSRSSEIIDPRTMKESFEEFIEMHRLNFQDLIFKRFHTLE